ncbi:type I-E CRISPR-associated protein Cse2/CasB [Streptomyces sp. V2I9]|uniref:type I-E CRISPR-associated protein Cse2/CasB n=1 Tax=Streptomyces sp. V2I9 TaxID=3042304 RepID=UPI002783872F|nr:type I-E CRISPR-associated protein Cse2/CasB [Streptomyces sp. V2I9]MDQ0986673.1 CRISPR system Cascade subunit CasB [Streptomyces sp. V2I9]
MTATPPPITHDAPPAPPAGVTTIVPQQSGTARRSHERAFTTRVEQVCSTDPGARSALRSGLRKDLDSVRRMHRLIARWLPERRSPDVERAYYAVAAMIAAQPRSALASAGHADDGPVQPGGQELTGSAPRRHRTSLGTAFATAVTEGPGREKEMRAGTAESRLNLLTRQSVNGLHRHLPSSVGYLRSLGVEIDWAQLLDDLGSWRTRSGRISRTWLQDFYRLRNEEAAHQADEADEQEQVAGPTEAPDSP